MAAGDQGAGEQGTGDQGVAVVLTADPARGLDDEAIERAARTLGNGAR